MVCPDAADYDLLDEHIVPEYAMGSPLMEIIAEHSLFEPRRERAAIRWRERLAHLRGIEKTLAHPGSKFDRQTLDNVSFDRLPSLMAP